MKKTNLISINSLTLSLPDIIIVKFDWINWLNSEYFFQNKAAGRETRLYTQIKPCKKDNTLCSVEMTVVLWNK